MLVFLALLGAPYIYIYIYIYDISSLRVNKEDYLTSISLCERCFRNVCTKLHGDIAEHRNDHSRSHQNLGIYNRSKICTMHVMLLQQVNKGGDTWCRPYVYSSLIGKPQKTISGLKSRGSDDNIKMVLTARWPFVQWIQGIQSRVPWTFFAETTKMLWFHKSCKLFGQLIDYHLDTEGYCCEVGIKCSTWISMFHLAFFNSIIDKHQRMHFFTFKTVLV